MNETMGSIIMRLRKDRGLTQEQLANELGISYQAVSKWETGNSCPDLTALPLLADLFGVSIDALFGRTETETAPVTAAPESAADALPWPDDGGFYAVLYRGHELIGSQGEAKRVFRFAYEGPAQNVSCSFDLEITGEVCGDVTCDDVDGSVTAGGDVTCDEIAGSAFAGESVHSEHLDLDMDGDIPGQLGEEFARGIGNLSAWGADLGRRIADAVERSLGKPGRPTRPDEEDEDDE